jgi:septal ring factor EnvC (AmiA/AmiB activator)
MSPSAHLDVATILSGVLPEWEVEETTHIPMHMKNCEDCVHFALHVASQTRGGASEILIEKQKRHWRKVLERDFKKVREDGRKLADKEKDSEIERLNNEVEDLRDKISWYRSQLNAIEDDNNDLQCDIRRAREDLRCANDLQRGPVHRGRARTGHTGYNT